MNEQTKILKAIQEGNKDEAKQMTQQAYYPNFEKTLMSAYAHINVNGEEVEKAFENAYQKLCKDVETGKVNLQNGQINGLNPSMEKYLLEEGYLYLKNMIQTPEQNPKDFDLIWSVQVGGDKAIREAYRELRDYFTGYASKHFSAVQEADVLDVYQDSLIVVIEYIQNGRIRIEKTEEGSLIVGLRNGATIKTLLVSIGRRKLIKLGDTREYPTEPDTFQGRDFNLKDVINHNREEDARKLEAAFSRLGEKCKKILYYKYWMKMSYEEIADIMGYSSAGAVRIQKFRCMNDLRNLMDDSKD